MHKLEFFGRHSNFANDISFAASGPSGLKTDILLVQLFDSPWRHIYSEFLKDCSQKLHSFLGQCRALKSKSRFIIKLRQSMETNVSLASLAVFSPRVLEKHDFVQSDVKFDVLPFLWLRPHI